MRDARFVQCHRSYIVNMDDIDAVAEGEITMRSGARIPISRSYPEVRSELLRRMLEDE